MRPRVETNGGTAEVAKSGDLISKVQAADTPARYTGLVTPVLDEVDNLEKIFKKQGGRTGAPGLARGPGLFLSRLGFWPNSNVALRNAPYLADSRGEAAPSSRGGKG